MPLGWSRTIDQFDVAKGSCALGTALRGRCAVFDEPAGRILRDSLVTDNLWKAQRHLSVV
jgi:hypothetical protein